MGEVDTHTAGISGNCVVTLRGASGIRQAVQLRQLLREIL